MPSSIIAKCPNERCTSCIFMYVLHFRKLLETFHMASLRRILGIKWQDKITNVDVLKDSSMLSIHSLLMKRRLRWIGHVRRMDDGRIP